MRMSVMYGAVALLTGINLFYIPFQPVEALWGAGLSVAFILLNILADKMRLWSGVPWTIAAGVIMAAMLQGQGPGEGLRMLVTVFAFMASVWYCIVQYIKEKKSQHPQN
ncbi:hypothetical protein [Klebsiella oxytoca]|uniref:hypothetical protein n=1 Tax=Klebsiella oxytoca TaxID=571 RepID=UPI00190E87C6|nr:hypothetical protein [Klebsiella oxytoca]